MSGFNAFNFNVGDRVCMAGWENNRFVVVTAVGSEKFLGILTVISPFTTQPARIDRELDYDKYHPGTPWMAWVMLRPEHWRNIFDDGTMGRDCRTREECDSLEHRGRIGVLHWNTRGNVEVVI